MGSSAHTPIAVRLVTALAAAAIFLLIVPIYPHHLHVGLDPSWRYGLNEALENGLIFGRDLIFTFGPLGPVDTRLYSPETYPLMLVGGAIVAVAFCTGAMLAFPRRRIWFLALMSVVILTFQIKDPIFAIISLFQVLGAVRLTLPADHPYALNRTQWARTSVAVLSVAIGLMPLIKGSLSGIILAEGTLAILALVLGRRPGLAIVIVLVAILSTLLGWRLTGQPLDALPQFFISQWPIIAGYTEAMTIDGPVHQTLSILAGGVVVMGCVWLTACRFPKTPRRILVLAVALYLFVQFKAGFVRQDSSHTPIASTALLLVAIIVASYMDSAHAALLLAVSAICAYGALVTPEPDSSLAYLAKEARGMAIGSVTSIGNLFDQSALRQRYERGRLEVARLDALPKVVGSVDIYPTELAAIFANRLTWSGRPVFQSYSAYTPALDRINAGHLLGANAPQHIFFEVAPIDGRLPALEDASSWPILLSSYTISDYRPRFLQLDRQPTTSVPTQTEIADGRFNLNEPIHVPRSGGPIVARAKIDLSSFGRLVSIGFRSPRMMIEVTTDDGQTRVFRYIPTMGETGFVLSPFVGTTDDFLKLATGDSKLRRVTSIRFLTPHSHLWTRNFEVSFWQLHVKAQRNPFVSETSGPVDHVPFDAATTPAGGECSLDYIDGTATSKLPGDDAKAAHVVNLMGWMVSNGKAPQGADQLFVELTSTDGTRRFFSTNRYPRPDVMAHFNDFSMRQPGFSASLDVSQLSGKQRISYYGVQNGHAVRCSISTTLSLKAAS